MPTIEIIYSCIFFTAMSHRRASAPHSVDGTHIQRLVESLTSLHGSEYPHQPAIAILRKLHRMQTHQLMLLSVLLPMSWLKLLLIPLVVVGATRVPAHHALPLELLRMLINVHGTSQQQLF